MKVLSIINSMELNQGGPPVVLRNQISVINKEKKIISVFKLKDISIYFLLKCFFLYPARKKIYKFLQKFDVIHFHELWSIKTIFLSYFAEKICAKHFFVGHGYLDPWSINERYIKKKLFIKFFLQYAYKSACASFFSTKAEFLDAKKTIKCENIFIIPNGVDLNIFKRKKFKEQNIKKKKNKIIYFGRIHKKKGIEILLNAIKNLPEYFFDNFYFEITGPGESKYVDIIKNIIKESNLEQKVNLRSPISRYEKVKYLSGSDVFILPSFEEGDSIALKEALASSLPVIISQQCRMNIVEEYNAGLVVETNEESVFKALIKITKLDLVKMGQNAKNLIRERYDNNECSTRLLHIYEDIYTGSHESKDWIQPER